MVLQRPARLGLLMGSWTETSAATFGATTLIYTVVDSDPVVDLNSNVGAMEDPVALTSPTTESVPAKPARLSLSTACFSLAAYWRYLASVNSRRNR